MLNIKQKTEQDGLWGVSYLCLISRDGETPLLNFGGPQFLPLAHPQENKSSVI